MAELENLEILIDVIEQYEEELNHLLAKLGQVESAVRAVDDIRIDVDVHGESELNSLMAKMGALEAMDMSGVGDIDVGSRGGGGAVAGGAMSGDQFGRLDNLLSAQVRQMGKIIKQFDGLGESTDDLARAQRSAMTAADKAADSFELSNLRMSDLHNALAKMLPLLAVFIGTLPALVTALVAVAAAAFAAAAALAAMTVFGAMGAGMVRGNGDMMEGLQEILNELQADFMDAFTPIMRQFRPLFEDTMEGLGMLFQRIANLDHVLRSLEDEARRFGDFISDFTVGTIRDMGRMVEAFDGVFSMIAGFMQDMDLLMELTQFMGRVLPELTIFTALAVETIIRLVEMSEGFLLVATAIGVAISFLFDLMDFLGVSNKQMGVLIATVLTAATAYFIFSSSIMSAVIPSLAALGTKMLAAISSLTGYSASTVVATLATYGLAKAFLVLIGTLTLGIGAIVTAVGVTKALGSGFGALAGDVQSATDSLRAFKGEASGLDGANPYGAPQMQPGDVSGSSRFGGGGGITVNVEGDADEETLREQLNNGLYWMERPGRGK